MSQVTSDIQTFIQQILAENPEHMWDNFLHSFGGDLTEGNINQYIARLLGGNDATAKAGEYRTNAMNDVNRTYGGIYNTMRNKSATGGGRHSSAEAKLLASGVEGYQGSRNAVEQSALTYEDTIRNMLFNKGSNIMNLVNSMKQNDVTNTQNWLTQLQGGYGLDLSAMGMDYQTMLGLLPYQTGQSSEMPEGFNDYGGTYNA